MPVSFTIQHKIPVPAKWTCSHSKYPFGDMKVGDSFEIPPGIEVSAVRTTASMYKLRKGPGFSIRKVSSNGQPAKYRVWRVS